MLHPAKMEHPASARLCTYGGSQLETGTTSELAAWTTQTSTLYGSARLQARVQQRKPGQQAHTSSNATTVTVTVPSTTNGSYYLGRGDCVIQVVNVSPAFLFRIGIADGMMIVSILSRLFTFFFFLSNHPIFSCLGSEQQGVDQLWNSSSSTNFGLLNTLFHQQSSFLSCSSPIQFTQQA